MATKRPTPRPAPRREQKDSGKRPVWVGVLCIVCILLTGLAVWWAVTTTAHSEQLAEQLAEYTSARYPTRDGLTYTYVNDPLTPPICVYVVTDPDTGLEYLVSDRGGITPRMGAE